MTLIVDEAPEAKALSKAFFAKAGCCQKVGVCGPPGAGKSTLTARLVSHYRKLGLKVGVLAVDPSSPISGGAFLGDRLRIQEHATDPGVFIRSLASRGMVGGVSHTIFGAIHVLEALGCDKILVETVGTGQDEVQISRVADTVVYVTTPQMGDEIQAMKAGIMEIGDIFVVNKADLVGADKAVADLRGALSLGRSAGQAAKPWETPVLAATALTGEGVPALGKALDAHWTHLKKTDEGRARLKAQHREELSVYVSRRAYQDALGRVTEKSLEDMVEHRIDPASLGARMLKR
jgi:LAO/AO transport system kinase